ncbi:hypothetical protein MCUN1_000011 [Malassezia cuniculi]|uniref:Small nuclear ribonucleoprotein G n=1 Tax=Malassezia cuniculi TaxID=948313 RepID=A0AAF0EM76_9BASI|nr:hypothetical protein MCUN1_000011 [Malassezia cuniculi]
MSKVSQPELKRFLDKHVSVNIQGGRKVQGTLRGYDLFLNLVIDNAVEHIRTSDSSSAGAWHEGPHIGTVVIRGNSVTSLEGLEAINTR